LYEEADSVEIKYRKLQEKFQEIYSNNSEVLVNKEKRRRKNKPWVTPEIIRESEKRDKLLNTMKNSPKNTVRQKQSHFLSPCSHGDFSFPWG